MKLARRSVRSRTLPQRLICGVMVLSLLAGCGKDAGADKPSNTRAVKGESGLASAGDPVRGGRLVYAIEGESDGFCLPEAQLAISGTMVRTATQPSSASGDTVGACRPGAMTLALSSATIGQS